MAELSDSPAPVFIVGSIRSGASLLALSLGQHPRFTLSMENRWLEPFMIGLLRSYSASTRSRAVSQLEINGQELESFFAHFGPAAEQILRGVGPGSQRVIDATPMNAFLITPLRMLFPRARFIHLVRIAGDVASVLSDADLKLRYKSTHVFISEKLAYDHWLQAVTACIEAEHAYGSESVLRVRRNDLVAQPEASIRRCLDFLGEDVDPACLRAFSSIPPELAAQHGARHPNAGALAPAAARSSADLLGSVLAEQGSVFSPGDEEAAWELRAAMWNCWTHGESLIPSIPGMPVRGERSKSDPPAAKRTAKPVSQASSFRPASRIARLLGRNG